VVPTDCRKRSVSKGAHHAQATFALKQGSPAGTKAATSYLFPGKSDGRHLSLRQYSRIYKRTRNIRAIQLLVGHTKLESTVRYLGMEVDDALEIPEQTEIQFAHFIHPASGCPTSVTAGRARCRGRPDDSPAATRGSAARGARPTAPRR
jgi:hypothetical protein